MPRKDGCSNPYDPNDVSKKFNISLEEAAALIVERKSKTNGSLQNFIKRHGEVEGTRRFKIFIEKSINNKDSYLKRYGHQQGLINWEKTRKKKDKFSLNYFITTFGEELGKIKFEETCNKNKQTLESFIEKFGDEKGKIEYSKYCYKKTKGIRDNKACIASKESMVFFEPIIKFLVKKGLYCNFGNGSSKEFRLYSKKTRKNYYYDLTIIKLKLIIEYDGVSHPNDKCDPKTWRCVFRGISYEEALKYDQLKQECAEQHGYKLIRINYLQAEEDKVKWQRYIINLIRELINENQINQKAA